MGRGRNRFSSRRNRRPGFHKRDSLPTGEGFTWANDTLKLSDLNIEAENENGIVLPDGATIVLSGNNTINFKHTMQDTGAAIKGIGSLAFTGDGTLNINSSYEGYQCSRRLEDKRRKDGD